jgi:Cytochrome C'
MLPAPYWSFGRRKEIRLPEKTKQQEPTTHTHIMKRRIFIFSASFAIIGAAFALFGAEQKLHNLELRGFMRQKLVYSEGILEGMTLEKYDLVSKNAIRLRNMSQSNIWVKARNADYLRYTTNFQKSADALALAAADKNLDAVTDAYNKVTKNCVECHRLVRQEQRVVR